MGCSTLGFLFLRYLQEHAQTHIPWVNDAIQPSPPLLPPFLPALNFPQLWNLFQWVGSLHQVTKVWNFSFSISSFSEYSGLISFRIDWSDLAVQGTLKSLLQHYNSKALILWHSAIFMGPALISVHDYWKNHNSDSTDLCQQSDVSAY